MTYPADGKPRLRPLRLGDWLLTPPQPIWPDYRECYVGQSAREVYELWKRDLCAPYDLALQISRDRIYRRMS